MNRVQKSAAKQPGQKKEEHTSMPLIMGTKIWKVKRNLTHLSSSTLRALSRI